MSVLELDAEREEYLRELHDIFTTGPQYEVPEADLVRLCHDALEAWKAQLPAAALTSRRLTPAGQRLQELIRKEGDPVRLILHDLPRLAGEQCANSNALEGIKSAKQELMDVTRTYAQQAGAAVRRAIRLGDREGRKRLRRVAREWAGCFSQSFVERMGTASTTTSLLKIMQMDYKSEARSWWIPWPRCLSGQPLARWDDSTIATFERELQTTVQQIEEAALEHSGLLEDSSAAHGLSRLVEGRIDDLFGKLVDLVGEVEAEKRLAMIQQMRDGRGAPWLACRRRSTVFPTRASATSSASPAARTRPPSPCTCARATRRFPRSTCSATPAASYPRLTSTWSGSKLFWAWR